MDSFIYFIKSNYDLLFKCAEVLAAIIGIFLFKKYKNDNAAKLFIYFLIYVNVVETIGSYTNILRGYPDDNWIKLAFKNTIFNQNYWWYTLMWDIGASIFLSFYFFKILKTNFFKKVVKYFSVILILYQIILFIYKFDLLINSSILNITMLHMILVVVLTSLYFIELINSDSIIKFYKSLPFYVATATLIFTIIQTPIYFFESYYNTNDESFIALQRTINVFSIILMYFTFGYGLIKSEPDTTT
ncbi:hypothetical protein [Mesoflavibacter sp. CH_XMU1422-2]|uniref:hypothetical protein n=1 Tax=Mesoflavibacter sp. CH_XMU1422-2 TaxID=3107770 RepID=UPI003009649F|nr:hypothetical protein [Mesoflavibacter sp.]